MLTFHKIQMPIINELRQRQRVKYWDKIKLKKELKIVCYKDSYAIDDCSKI